MAHRSTWESPANHSESGRKNPYRNLIDYIIIRKQQRGTIQDSRAHNGLMTYTDHRLVGAKMNLERIHIKKENHKQKLNLEKLQNPITRARYAVSVEMKIMDAEENRNEEQNINAQEQWNNIVEANHKSAQEILGRRKKRQEDSQKVQELSDKQKKIYQQINSISEEEKKKELRQERNKVMKETHSELGKIAERKIEREISEIEEARDNSNRMYKAVKNIRTMKGKEAIMIQHEGGITTDADKQTEIISEYF